MPRIHWLREKQRPGEGTVAAEKRWEWCKAHLGRLQYLRPLGRPPSLQHEGKDGPEQADWDIFRVFPEIPPSDRRAFWRTLEDEQFLSQRAIPPEAAEAVRRLRASGHDLFLVTGRLPWHRAPIIQWLAGQGLGEAFADLLVKQPRLPREKHKREAAAALRLDAFVEDERRTAEALATLPLSVFLLDRPWNWGLSVPGLHRVRSWAEILSHLATISGTVPI